MSFVQRSPVRLASVLLLVAVACVAAARTQRIKKEDAGGVRPLGVGTATIDSARASIYTNSRVAGPAPGCDDVWTATSVTNTPVGRFIHTAVWTGSEMIVWGGYATGMRLRDGGRYTPGSDTWAATSLSNAPSARSDHTAIWTGSEMIVWGGFTDAGQSLNDGGRYNPSTDSWTPMNNANAPDGRANHTAIWTGSEMIVWGGSTQGGLVNTGGRYNPSTDTWTPLSVINAPSGRAGHVAVWTGSEMIVWGGTDSPTNYFANGAKYNPATGYLDGSKHVQCSKRASIFRRCLERQRNDSLGWV